MTDETPFDYTQPHKIVDGVPVLLTADEIAEDQAREAAWEAGETRRTKAKAQDQIDQLERNSAMPRPVRDMLIASSVTNVNAKADIQALEDQIAALRIIVKGS